MCRTGGEAGPVPTPIGVLGGPYSVERDIRYSVLGLGADLHVWDIYVYRYIYISMSVV